MAVVDVGEGCECLGRFTDGSVCGSACAQKRLLGSWDKHLVPLAFENDRSLSLGGVSQLNSGSRSTGYSRGARGLIQSQDSLTGIYKPTQELWVSASFEWEFNTQVSPDGLERVFFICVFQKKVLQKPGNPPVNVFCQNNSEFGLTGF